MTWFGRDFAMFAGNVPEQNEDEWLSVVKPSELMRANCIYGDAVVCHFAYPFQEAHLESTDLLSRYVSIAEGNVPQNAESLGPLSGIDLWAPRLFDAIGNIGNASVLELTDPDYVAAQIRLAGLVGDSRFLYGVDNQCMNTGGAGLWQIPMQLARCLVQMSNYSISTAIEIGTWTGWTAALIAAYLARLNGEFHFTTVDIKNHFDCYPAIQRILPIDFHLGTSADFRESKYDLAFIDGDHTYDSCRADYQNVGRGASICIFHDINDEFVLRHKPNQGGVPRLWQEIKSQTRKPDEMYEFLDHSQDRQIMGIGMLVRNSAMRGRP
jgi:hypothetical protein